jgi:hypothetical protein
MIFNGYFTELFLAQNKVTELWPPTGIRVPGSIPGPIMGLYEWMVFHAISGKLGSAARNIVT